MVGPAAVAQTVVMVVTDKLVSWRCVLKEERL